MTATVTGTQLVPHRVKRERAADMSTQRGQPAGLGGESSKVPFTKNKYF